MDLRWCGDIKYIQTWEGWAYLATLIDSASRRVVGWALADHLRIDLVEQALRNAVTSHLWSDLSQRPKQYTSAQFTVAAEALDVRLSIGRRGQCWDNAEEVDIAWHLVRATGAGLLRESSTKSGKKGNVSFRCLAGQ